MKKLLFILMAIFQLFGCSANSKADLTYLHYSHGNSMVAGDFQEWTVKLENQNTAVVTVKKGLEENSYRTSSKLLDEISQIVERNRMRRFKGKYIRKNVLDGWNWGFVLRYKDGKSIEGNGYMKYPKGARYAFNELTEFIDHWCAVPDSTRMKIFEYSRNNGMVIGSGESYYVRKEKDGLVHIDINEGKNNERIFVTDYYRIFDDLQKLVMDYNIYTFKGSYMPDMDIRDGDSWRLSAYYEDSDFDISAHGYMAWPEGFNDAISAVRSYFNAWRVLAVQSEKVSKEAATVLLDEIAGGRKSVSFDSNTGGYSITTYDADGKPAQTINYSPQGMVLNGVDHNDPMKEY